MTLNTDTLPRADVMTVEPDHGIYRKWEIPGRRDSDYYDGSGVVKTYNMSDVEGQRLPDDEEAVPSLATVRVGNVQQKIIRKNVEHKTMVCPECEHEPEGVKTHTGEPFCPDCGLILSKSDARDVGHIPYGIDGQPPQRDAKAAGRLQGDGN